MTIEPMDTQEREPRDQNVAVRCTKSEKNDVQLVANLDQSTESETLRVHTMGQIRERAAAIRAAMPAIAA
jgi:hypothetical protein